MIAPSFEAKPGMPDNVGGHALPCWPVTDNGCGLYDMTIEAYQKFDNKYQKGEFPNQRYGQAFCNYCVIKNQELFYCKDETLAKELIMKKFVLH